MENNQINILTVNNHNQDFKDYEKIFPDYNIIMTNSAKDAIKKIHEDDFALVLMDVHMSEMSGIEATKHIDSVPVILISCKDVLEDKYTGFENGAVHYIVRPLNLTSLKTKVQRLVDIYLDKKRFMYKSIMPEKTIHKKLSFNRFITNLFSFI